MPFYVDLPKISVSSKQLKPFKPSEFNIVVQPRDRVHAFQFDYSTVYVAYIYYSSRVVNNYSPPEYVNVDFDILGNPVINLWDGKIVGHVNGDKAVLYYDELSKDKIMELVVFREPPVDFPKFIRVYNDDKSVEEEDCGVPVNIFDKVYFYNRPPVQKVVKCFGLAKYVEVSGLKIMTRDFYLYKFAKKTYDVTLLNYVQRLVSTAKENESLDAVKNLVEEDKRIKYLKVDLNNVKVEFELEINAIRVYSTTDESYRVIKLRKPLIMGGKLEAKIYDMNHPSITINDTIPHPNVIDRRFDNNITSGVVCTGNISIDVSSLQGIIATIKSILEVLQYPHLDNVELGNIFLNYLLKNGYLTNDDIPEPVKCRYDMISC